MIGPPNDQELGFVYHHKGGSEKKLLKFRQKNLVINHVLEMFINCASQSSTSEQDMKNFIDPLKWWIEVRIWIYEAQYFVLKINKQD